MTVRRHRRYSTEFKIQLVQAYLDGEGSARSIATRHEVPHSLLMVWIKKYEAGDLTREIHLQEEVVEYGAKIAALERKIGQLTMELDVMKKRALIRPSQQGARPSIISGVPIGHRGWMDTRTPFRWARPCHPPPGVAPDQRSFQEGCSAPLRGGGSPVLPTVQPVCLRYRRGPGADPRTTPDRGLPGTSSPELAFRIPRAVGMREAPAPRVPGSISSPALSRSR